MKAAYYLGNKKFELRETEQPKPSSEECLIRITRTGICGTDLKIYHGHLQDRVGKERVLGHETVGVIHQSTECGQFSVGDRVVIQPTISCGDCSACRRGHANVCQHFRLFGIDLDGAFQEYVTVPSKRLHKLGDGISDDHAAMIEPLAVAVHSIRVASIKAGEMVVVIGAGTIGLMAAMLAKRAGANVMILETNPYRIQFLADIGIEGYNPNEKDTHALLLAHTNGAGADVLIEASGSPQGAHIMTSLAAVCARIVLVGIHSSETKVDLYKMFSRELSLFGIRSYTDHDFRDSIRLAASGELKLNSLISASYPLEKIQDAFEHLEADIPVMKVLIHFHSRPTGNCE